VLVTGPIGLHREPAEPHRISWVDEIAYAPAGRFVLRMCSSAHIAIDTPI
jgi:hypothetical protein